MSFLKGLQSNLWRTSSFASSKIVIPTATSTSSAKPFGPFSKSVGGVAALSLFGFTLGNTSSSEGGIGSSQSSSLLREKSPAAFRKQPTTLVFVSAEKVLQSELHATREKWYNWIAYFREAGFDCLDVHLDVSDSTKAECDSIEKESKVLGEELSSQIALASLQRQPLIFARTSSSKAIQSSFESTSRTHSRPSGVILISSGNDDQMLSSISDFPEKLLVALVFSEPSAEKAASKSGARIQFVKCESDVDGEQAMREVERWMTSNGFA